MIVKIGSPADFNLLDQEFSKLLELFPLFSHDINCVRNTVNNHRDNFSRLLVEHRRTKNPAYLNEAQAELDAINAIMETFSKHTLLAMLAR